MAKYSRAEGRGVDARFALGIRRVVELVIGGILSPLQRLLGLIEALPGFGQPAIGWLVGRLRQFAQTRQTFAGQFLRGKWKAQETEIKTAQDFIEKAASKSSTTGQPYLIRQPNGQEIPSGQYLTSELRKLESEK